MAQKQPTRNEVAQYAGVSGATVSRVLSNRPDVQISRDARARVLKAAKHLGYRPNGIARALVTGRTDTVALWIAELHAYHAEIVRHIQRMLGDDRFEMVICDVTRYQTTIADFARHDESEHYPIRMSSLPVDGILAVDRPDRVRNLLLAHTKLRTPFVSLGSYQLDTVDYVAVDLRPGTVAAIKHLIESGCRRIAYVVWQDTNHPGDPRRDAYVETMQAAGLAPEYLLFTGNTRHSVREELPHYMNAGSPPDALFCFNDDMAIGAYKALHNLGLRVPDDILLVGCDGLSETEYLERPISTIVQPLEEMCRTAWRFLKNRIADPDAPLQQLILQPELVVRESSQREPAYRDL
ncbi:MAG TPA: LacI family DNA-binding transcriptional regulator [Capsulimonadaceae bacterium]|nr:LacI family DNA-binding transcriptional regulator [Capsulimonadaceae bacterium]